MAVIKIKVPKTPKSAFNKNRPASDLLKAQLEHLEAAAGNYQSESSSRRKASKSLTEGEVATRIYELTRKLHPITVGEQPAPVPVVTPIEDPPAQAPRSLARGNAAKKSTRRRGGPKARKKG
jgi:hypothetical protein